MFLALLLPCAGCVVGPDYKTPAFALPAHWWWGAGPTTPEKSPELAEWWERLRDPTLDDIIAQAAVGNTDVATARAKIREARATYRYDAAPLFPTLSGSGSAARSDSGSSAFGSPSISGAGISAGGPYNSFKSGFDASWELDLFGGNRRGTEAAFYGTEAADEGLRDALVTLIGDVAANYVEARGYQARIALARRTAASQRETVALTRSKFEAGSASAVDVANATGQAASTEAQVPALEIFYAEAVHRLSVLTGQPPSALGRRLRRTAPVPVSPARLPAGIPADILQTRPDVRMAERQYAQSTAKIGQAEANRYPRIKLAGNISTSGLQVSDLVKHSSIGWSFGPTLTVPIFQGGQLAAAVEIAEAQRDQFFIAYRTAVLKALEDVENAIVSFTQEHLRNGKLAQAAQSYRKAVSLARTRYQSGAASFLDVLDTERSLYTAEDSLLQSRVSIAKNYIALNKALGGSWSGTIDVSKPEIVDTNTGPHLAPAP